MNESDLPLDDAEGELPSPLRRSVSRTKGTPFALSRKSQLLNPTPELQARLDKLYTMLKAGNFVDTALALSGIDKQTFRHWCVKGKAEQVWWENEVEELLARGIDEPLDRGPYHDFLVKVDESIAMAEAADLDNIRKAGIAGNASASIWRLKKRAPKRWGDSPVTATLVPTQNNTQVNVSIGTSPTELQVRTLLQETPELADLLSLLAEKAETNASAYPVRDVLPPVASGGFTGPAGRRSARALESGPPELRSPPDAK